MKIFDVMRCPECNQTIKSKPIVDKRPTKNLDSLIKAINMSGAVVIFQQRVNNNGWIISINDCRLNDSVLAFYMSEEPESMYQALKKAVSLVTDRVISLCGYKPITM